MKYRILVIDDNRDFRAVVAHRLEKHPQLVAETCATVEEALYKMVEEPPDVILLDWMLGEGMQGFQAIGAIRSTSNAPILIVTGLPLDDEILRRLHLMNVAALHKGPKTVGVDFPLITKILTRIAKTGLVSTEPGWVE